MIEVFGNPLVVAALGFVVGTIGTVAGLGGGFFVVPYAMAVWDFHPTKASGTSIWLVLAISVSASVTNAIKGTRIDWRLGLILSAFMIPGSLVGPAVTAGLKPGPFRLAFAVLTLATAAYSAFGPSGAGFRGLARGRLAIAALTALATGFVASIFGVGGGVVNVPLLMFVFGMTPIASTATAQFAMVFTSLVTGLRFLADGHVDWRVVLWFGPGIVAGAQAGVWVADRVSRVAVRRILAAVYLIVAAELAATSGMF